VLGTEYPLKFLNGGRALKSVLSRNDTIRKAFYEHFGERFAKVRDYYELYREKCSSRMYPRGYPNSRAMKLRTKPTPTWFEQTSGRGRSTGERP
jgi:hypothetical protein